MEGLDETDLNIMRILQRNSKLTTKELAARVHLSTTPVFERLKRLENEGYIKRYVALLDAEKLDKGLCIMCNVRLKQHNGRLGREFMEAISKIDEVTECYNVSGDFDYILKIYVRNMKHYESFVLDTIGAIPSVGNIQSNFVMSIVKQSPEIPI